MRPATIFMTDYQKGEILLVSFPFADVLQNKRRPAMVVADTGDGDLLVARVTTQQSRDAFDVDIVNWRGAGLLASSVVRLHKLATIKKSLVERRLGKLTDVDRSNVGAILAQLFRGW